MDFIDSEMGRHKNRHPELPSQTGSMSVLNEFFREVIGVVRDSRHPA
jgi:aminoglycoside N3'-acetyltransferase